MCIRDSATASKHGARSLSTVIFGVKDDVTTDKVLDLIMLMAKYYIFRQMFKNHTKLYLFFERS